MSTNVTFAKPEKQDDGTTLVWAVANGPSISETISLTYGVNIAGQTFVSAWYESKDDDILTASTDDEPFDLRAGVFDLKRTEAITIEYKDKVGLEIDLLELILLDLIIDFAAYHDISLVINEN